jgi:hypothetical protein
MPFDIPGLDDGFAVAVKQLHLSAKKQFVKAFACRGNDMIGNHFDLSVYSVRIKPRRR